MKVIALILSALAFVGQAFSQTNLAKTILCDVDGVRFQFSYLDSVYRTGDTLTIHVQVANERSMQAYIFETPKDRPLRMESCESIVRWGGNWRIELGRDNSPRMQVVGAGKSVSTVIRYTLHRDSTSCRTPWDFVALAGSKAVAASVYFDVGLYLPIGPHDDLRFAHSYIVRFDSLDQEMRFDGSLKRFIAGPLLVRFRSR